MMNKTILQEAFYQELFDILEETFDTHHDVYLDKGTSLLMTLDQIGAPEASIPVGNRCATIAAQVEHVIYYMEVLERFILGQEIVELDWGEIWNRVSAVTDEEWEDLRGRAREAYARLKALLQSIDDWAQNDALGGSIAIVVHTAYHLGEIRQALCTVGKVGQ